MSTTASNRLVGEPVPGRPGDRLIEHRGVVRHVQDGKAVVSMETGGCSSCGHAGGCGLGKLVAGQETTTLVLPASPGMAPGDLVTVGLPEGRLYAPALLGYLFPPLAMLVGAAIGALLDGRDGATALGALGGFLVALAISRLLIDLAPGLVPTPQLISAQPVPSSIKEFDHDHPYR